jgi:hypothetical protein
VIALAAIIKKSIRKKTKKKKGAGNLYPAPFLFFLRRFLLILSDTANAVAQ